jgi:hypothetical protein
METTAETSRNGPQTFVLQRSRPTEKTSEKINNPEIHFITDTQSEREGKKSFTFYFPAADSEIKCRKESANRDFTRIIWSLLKLCLSG